MGDEFQNIEEQIEFARQEAKYEYELECRTMKKKAEKQRIVYLVILVFSVMIVSCLASKYNSVNCVEPLVYTKGQ